MILERAIRHYVSILSVAVLMAGCGRPTATYPTSESQAPLFSGMGSHGRIVSTDAELAQKYFDQGLTWAYAFNHDEAIKSFREAARLDPKCAMAYWGISLCNGPHINNPVMTPEQSKAAWEAIEKATALIGHANETEAALIGALTKRYAKEAPEDRKALDEAYAAAMQVVYASNKEDADIGCLYAESLMDLQPWDLWAADGAAKGRTNEVLAVLEHAMQIDPRHPGACHLYIHAVEASPGPERANAAADVLRTGVPISGHLVHMPSHIDVQTGRWAMASDQNVAAIKADKAYRKVSPKQGFNSVYMAHNHHFLAFSSMMEGRRNAALAAAKEMIAGVPPDFLAEQPQFIDPFMMIVHDVHKRFGEWDAILKLPEPDARLLVTVALHYFSRGIAYAAKGDTGAARQEQGKFREAVKRVPEDRVLAINPAHKVLAVAEHMLEGEIAFHEGKIEESVSTLRQGIEIEDTLLYMEPPEWIQSIRHTLGAVLVHEKRYAEAEAVYRQDLKNWPENPWSLLGLAKSLGGQGKTAEAAEAQKRFEKAWARADVKIASSCLCVPGESSR